MTKIRQHLLLARDEYEAARYPGDLTGDVLDRAKRPTAPIRVPAAAWRRCAIGIAGGAIAAGFAVTVFLYRPDTIDGVGSFHPSLDSIRLVVEKTGLWPRDDDPSTDPQPFRIVPDIGNINLTPSVPAAPDRIGPSTQESA